MKRIIAHAGVTLLEIMLVLAVAAMVIVMSIRYYQSSSTSQHTNSTIQQIQAITSAMDNIAQGGAGSYSGITASTLKAVLGSNNMKTVTNQDVEFTASTDGKTYSVKLPLPEPICISVKAKLANNQKYTSLNCASDGLSYTYDTSI